jgi:hypothetical protein
MLKGLFMLVYILPNGETHVWERDLQWEVCLYHKQINQNAVVDVQQHRYIEMTFECRKQQ